jgi:hypothetical protein
MLHLKYGSRASDAAQATIRHMFLWNPERVIIAHGDWVNTNGQEYLRQAFQWPIG